MNAAHRDLASVPAAEARTEALFTPAAFVAHMVTFERALLHACADAGLVAPEAAARIDARIGDGSWIDADDLLRRTAVTGTPVIPLLADLRSRLEPDDAALLHLGATSQDVVDTALMLQVGEGLAALEGELRRLAQAAAGHATTHRRTAMVGRTLMRHAVPISFGLRAARWLSTATRGVQRLRALADSRALQLGGAAGTLLPLGAAAAEVETALGRRLGLRVPDLPWHAERDRIADIVTGVGVVAAGAGKIARDLLLLSTEEVGEVSFGGGGGSSAMPHKQNPVDLMYARTAAHRCAGAVATFLHTMDHEHERAAGGWQAEGLLVADTFRAAGALLHRLANAMAQLQPHPDRMAANLAASGGMVMSEALATALSERLGAAAARTLTAELIRSAAASGLRLDETARADARVLAALAGPGPGAGAPDLAVVFDPSAQLGSAERFIDRALAAYDALGPPPERRADPQA